jgi:hypothetical protein
MGEGRRGMNGRADWMAKAQIRRDTFPFANRPVFAHVRSPQLLCPTIGGPKRRILQLVFSISIEFGTIVFMIVWH